MTAPGEEGVAYCPGCVIALSRAVDRENEAAARRGGFPTSFDGALRQRLRPVLHGPYVVVAGSVTCVNHALKVWPA
jgi:hypothetical protein